MGPAILAEIVMSESLERSGPQGGSVAGVAPHGGRATAVGLLLLLTLAVVLRSVQYFGFVEMWHDELALARNVEDHGLLELISGPLDHRQVAPAGFMAALEAGAALLGVGEPGLRLFPWLFSLLGVVLFWRVARRHADGVPLLAAVGLFAVSPALIWYSTSVKPYGTDVTVSLLLVWLTLLYLDRPDGVARAGALGVVGGAALLLSFPAVPTAAVLGAVLLLAWSRRRPRPGAGPLAALGAGWALGAAVAAGLALGMMDAETDSFMRDFWAEDFPPAGRPLAAAAWAAGRYYQVFAHSLTFVRPESALHVVVALPLILAAAGLWVGLRRRALPTCLLLAPVAAGLGAAFTGLLPFDQRLGLHATWPVLVLAGAGLAGLRDALPGRWRYLAHALAAVVVAPLLLFVLLARQPPYHGTQVRPVLAELAERYRPGDEIYVYTQGRHAMAFYGRRAGLEEWIQGERHYGDPRGYLREVDALRGNPRAWFFWVRLDNDEPAMVRGYLGAIGRELARIPEDGDFDGAGAVLYDLSAPERLGRHNAESYPLPED